MIFLGNSKNQIKIISQIVKFDNKKHDEKI